MIFVTVGISGQFNRLIEKLDELKEKKIIKDEIIAQISESNPPKNFKYFRYIEIDKIKLFIEKSKFVITHGGIGSIFFSLEFNKPTIVIPRLRKFKEHTNDHQLQIVKELEKENLVIPIYDIDELENAIKKLQTLKIEIKKIKENKMKDIIISYLKKIEGY